MITGRTSGVLRRPFDSIHLILRQIGQSAFQRRDLGQRILELLTNGPGVALHDVIQVGSHVGDFVAKLIDAEAQIEIEAYVVMASL